MANVRLEPLGAEHAAALAALLDDDAIRRFTRIPVPTPPAFAGDWVQRYALGREEGTREAFAGIGEDAAFLGVALAPHVDREAGEAELGYLVAPEARGRGVATALLEQLTRWAFDEAGLHRAELIIDVENAPSLRVARHCGYFHEGTKRSTWLKAGFPRVDVTIWSRLRTD